MGVIVIYPSEAIPFFLISNLGKQLHTTPRMPDYGQLFSHHRSFVRNPDLAFLFAARQVVVFKVFSFHMTIVSPWHNSCYTNGFYDREITRTTRKDRRQVSVHGV